MKFETKFRLQMAAVCGIIGFVAAPKVLNGLIKATQLVQKACDAAIKEVL